MLVLISLLLVCAPSIRVPVVNSLHLAISSPLCHHPRGLALDLLYATNIREVLWNQGFAYYSVTLFTGAKSHLFECTILSCQFWSVLTRPCLYASLQVSHDWRQPLYPRLLSHNAAVCCIFGRRWRLAADVCHDYLIDRNEVTIF